MKNIFYFFSLTLFFNAFQAYSQNKTVTDQDRLAQTIAKATEVGLASEKINQIKEIYTKLSDSIAHFEKEQEKFLNNSILCFYDQKQQVANAQLNFRKDLARIINTREFEKLFGEQFKSRIYAESQQKYHAFIQSYELTKQQKKKAEQVIFENTKNEIITWAYYTYDNVLGYAKVTESKVISNKRIKGMLTEFGISKKASSINNPKIEFLVTRAQSAGLTEEQVERLLIAVENRDDKIKAYPNIWAQKDMKYVLNIHDQSTSKEEAHRKFKEDLANILSVEQFKAIFGIQLKSQIDYEVEKHLKKSKEVYKFDPLQESDLRQLLKKHYTNRLVYNEYYEYDWTLRSQKLKVLDFRFKKEYRNLIESFNE